MYGIDDEREVKNLLWNKFMNFLGFYVIFRISFFSIPPLVVVCLSQKLFFFHFHVFLSCLLPLEKKNYRLSAIYEQSCNKYIELSAFYVFESHREREKRTKLKCNMMHKMREVHINISNSFLHLLAFFIKEGGCLKISSSRELFSFYAKNSHYNRLKTSFMFVLCFVPSALFHCSISSSEKRKFTKW